jgi:hypothetical protein
MLSYTRLTFYDEYSVLLLRFSPQFWLILHLLRQEFFPQKFENEILCHGLKK